MTDQKLEKQKKIKNCEKFLAEHPFRLKIINNSFNNFSNQFNSADKKVDNLSLPELQAGGAPSRLS